MSLAPRQQPLAFCVVRETLRWGWIVAVSLALFGCTTVIHHSNGQPWIKTPMDSTTFYAKSGEEVIYVTGMRHSTPTRAALLGADRIAKTVSGAVVAGFVPGVGTAATVGRVGVATAPHLFSDPKPDVLTK